MIPGSMISNLIRERKARNSDVKREIHSMWGEPQTITGPILNIPYKEDDLSGIFHILPENLTIAGDVIPEIRYRSIFKSVVYSGNFTINGTFSIPDYVNTIPNKDFSESYFSFGISDLKGIDNEVFLHVDDLDISPISGNPDSDLFSSGIHFPIKHTISDSFDFSIEISLKGSEQILFNPLGKTTDVFVTSSWSNPSFIGNFLPDDRDVTDKGFSSKWNIFNLNRNYPQYWKNNTYDVGASEFGVKFLIANDHYQQSMRSIKYSFLFIVLTFAAFFLLEIIKKERIHPIQYLLIGLCLIFFYSLLLALSEVIGFTLAYIISSISIISLIFYYSYNIIKSKIYSYVIVATLVILYSFLYLIIQVKDFALLTGNLGLLAVLAIILIVTRKISWFSINNTGEE